MTSTSMPLTVFTKPWRDKSLPELAEFVRDLGFTGIELPVRPGYQVPPEDVANLPAAAKILSEHGVRIGSVAGPTDEATIASRIYDGLEGNWSPKVDWCGYLDEEGGEVARTDVRCVDLVVCDGPPVVWPKIDDHPYMLYSALYVCPTGHLVIEPGVTVHSLPYTNVYVHVRGQLDVTGEPGNEVTFTSDAGTPSAGDWMAQAIWSS